MSQTRRSAEDGCIQRQASHGRLCGCIVNEAGCENIPCLRAPSPGADSRQHRLLTREFILRNDIQSASRVSRALQT